MTGDDELTPAEVVALVLWLVLFLTACAFYALGNRGMGA